MTYWLALATALPVVTLVSLGMALRSERLGFDTVVLCWLVGLWGGSMFGLIFYDDAFNPLPSILVSALFPPLKWWRLTVKGSESLERGAADAMWASGFLMTAGIAATAVVMSGIWIQRQTEPAVSGMPKLLVVTLMVINGITMLVAFWALLRGVREST